METLVANCMEMFGASRKKTSLVIAAIYIVLSVIVCMGYSVFYFELTLPNGSVGQLLDVMDYISNSFLMPVIALLTCVLIGWVVKPKWIEEEMEHGGYKFGRKQLYTVIVKYVAPVVLAVLFMQSTGILTYIEKLIG